MWNFPLSRTKTVLLHQISWCFSVQASYKPYLIFFVIFKNCSLISSISNPVIKGSSSVPNFDLKSIYHHRYIVHNRLVLIEKTLGEPHSRIQKLLFLPSHLTCLILRMHTASLLQIFLSNLHLFEKTSGFSGISRRYMLLKAS